MENQSAKTGRYYSLDEAVQEIGFTYQTFLKWRDRAGVKPVRFHGSNTRWYTEQDITAIREVIANPWKSGDIANEPIPV